MPDKENNSNDDFNDAFAQIFNDALPENDAEEVKETVAPIVASQSSQAKIVRSANLTPSRITSQKAAPTLRDSSTKNDSQAVRNLENAAALRQSSTRLGDFAVEQKLPEPVIPKEERLSIPPPLPDLGAPPPVPKSSAFAADDWDDVVKSQQSEDKDSITRMLDRVPPAVWKVLGGALLTTFIFFGAGRLITSIQSAMTLGMVGTLVGMIAIPCLLIAGWIYYSSL